MKTVNNPSRNERLAALKILITLWQKQLPLSHLLTAESSAFCKELCFGVCRHAFRLQVIADYLLQKRPKDTAVWICLLLGLYQLYYSNSPDYAVVQETVALLDRIKKSWAKGLVNAVLRQYCREHISILAHLANDQAFRFGHPGWLVQRLQQAWPEDWPAILTANDQHPPMHLRVNQAHNSVTDYLTRLQQVNMMATRHSEAPNALTLAAPCAVQNLPGFNEGDVSVQDVAAQLAVTLMDLKPNLRVLDACCAPGGKLCHLLELYPTITAFGVDLDAKRLQRVQDNLTRLHCSATLIQGDASRPSDWWQGQLFDRILLDAPCSATGVIRRHPDIKLLRTPAEINAIVQLQRALLHALWPLLAPNGRLVYATCSILPEENEQQVAAFVSQQDDCHVQTIEASWGQATAHGRQILPGTNNMDGFFYSVLQKLPTLST